MAEEHGDKPIRLKANLRANNPRQSLWWTVYGANYDKTHYDKMTVNQNIIKRKQNTTKYSNGENNTILRN